MTVDHPCTCRALGAPHALKHDPGCQWRPASAAERVASVELTSPVEQARVERDTRAPAKGNGHTPPQAFPAVQPGPGVADVAALHASYAGQAKPLHGLVAAAVDAIREREAVELQVLRAKVAELEGRLAKIAEMAKGAP